MPALLDLVELLGESSVHPSFRKTGLDAWDSKINQAFPPISRNLLNYQANSDPNKQKIKLKYSLHHFFHFSFLPFIQIVIEYLLCTRN